MPNADQVVRQEPGPILPPNHISGLASNDLMNGDQASETYKVNAQPGQVLASGGQTLGFAKRVVGERTKELQQQTAAQEQSLRDQLTAAGVSSNTRGQIMTAFASLQKLKEEYPDALPARKAQIEELQAQLEANIDRYLAPLGENKAAMFEKLEEFTVLSVKRDQSEAMDSKTREPAMHLFDEGKLADTNKPAPEIDRTFLGRAAASKAMDELIGTNIISDEKLGTTPDGKQVGISVAADGAQVFMINKVLIDGERKKVTAFLQAPGPNGEPSLYESNEVQKGLYDLEVQDYLSGQVDRHAGNMVINPATGKVTGIDNDMAFPEVPRDQMFLSGHVPSKPVPNLPRYMHSETADKLMKTTPDELRAKLESVVDPSGRQALSPREIEGAVTRLGELQNHVQDLRLQGRVLDTFTKETHDEAINHQNQAAAASRQARKDPHNTSYLGSIELSRQEAVRVCESVGYDAIPNNEVRISPKDPEHQSMQMQVNAQKEQYRQHPESIPAENLRETVTATNARLEELNTERRQQVQDMEGVGSRLTTLRRSSSPDPEQIAMAEEAYKGAVEMHTETLKKIANVQQRHDQALDRAVAPLKPSMTVQARKDALVQHTADLPPLQQRMEELTAQRAQLVGQREALKGPLAERQKQNIKRQIDAIDKNIADLAPKLDQANQKVEQGKRDLDDAQQAVIASPRTNRAILGSQRKVPQPDGPPSVEMSHNPISPGQGQRRPAPQRPPEVPPVYPRPLPSVASNGAGLPPVPHRTNRENLQQNLERSPRPNNNNNNNNRALLPVSTSPRPSPRKTQSHTTS